MLSREHITDALRFWELGRIPYNVALAALVLLAIGPSLFASATSWESWAPFRPIFLILAVLANVLYCAAYPVDLFVQASDFRDGWRKWRWALWLIGTALALAFAWLILLGVSGALAAFD